MKKIKRLASLMLAVIMALAMSVTAFADEDGAESSQPTAPKGQHTYQVYQIFTGDYANGVLSNVKWGQNGTGTQGEKVDKDTLDALEAVANNPSDTEQLKVIQQYAKLGSTPIRTGSETTFQGLTPGYYLVKDTDGSLEGTNEAYTLYVVQVVNDILTFTPKSDKPTVDKTIIESGDSTQGDGTKVTEASIGDVVKYQIVGTMPSNLDAYTKYFYQFTDTLSAGLDYNENSLKITINGDPNRDITDKFTPTISKADTGTIIELSIEDIKTLSGFFHKENGDPENITSETKIIVTYEATLNEDAVIAGDGNKNDVKLTYSNDPNHSGEGSNSPKGETPTSEVTTYTTELTILKTDENNKFLPGVEFTLTSEEGAMNVVLVTEEKFAEDVNGEYYKLKDGTYTKTAPTAGGNSGAYESTTQKYSKTTTVVAKGNGKTETKVVGTVQADGTVTFKGLGAGKYTIEETKTLDGYNTIDPIIFNLTFDPEKKAFSSDNKLVTVGTDNMLDSTIVNQSGSLLPSTGGIGTTIFYIIGGVLVVAAGILLVVKKRMQAE